MINWLVTTWDWWIYKRAYYSIQRIIDKNPGIGYFIKLHIDEFYNQNPVDEDTKVKTENFFKDTYNE